MKFWGQSLSQGHYQPSYQQARKGLIYIYFITLLAMEFRIAENARKKPVLIWWRCFVFFLCIVQFLTRKKARRSQEWKLGNKALFSSRKNKFQLWKTECAKFGWQCFHVSAAGNFFSFKRLLYFTVSKNNVLNSLLYKMTQFKFG